MEVMEKRKIVFSINKIIVEGRACILNDFDSIKREDRKTFTIESEIVRVIELMKDVFENRFVALYFKKGEKYPYCKDVFNSKQEKIIKNPRSVDNIELSEPIFLLIDLTTSRIFISDQKKKAEIMVLLKEITNKFIEIKPLMKQKEFIDKIRTVKEISFSAEPNMFTKTNTLSENLVEDIYGYGAKEATLKLKYDQSSNFKVAREKIRAIYNKRECFKNITIIGRTSDKFEKIFNIEEVVGKLSLNITIDTNTKLFNKDEVFTSLITKIKEKNEN